MIVEPNHEQLEYNDAYYNHIIKQWMEWTVVEQILSRHMTSLGSMS